MQYTNLVLLALATAAVAQNSTTKAGKSNASETGTTTKAGKSAAATDASATGTMSSKMPKVTGKNGNSTASGKAGASGGKASPTGGKMNGSATGGVAVATSNDGRSLLAQGGGFVTIAGLGVVFAVFM